MNVHDERLVDYALDLLSVDERQRVEAELRGSPALRAELAALEAALAGVGESAEPLRPAAWLRETLLRSLDPATPLDGFVERLSRLVDLGAAEVRALLAALPGAPGGRWETGSRAGVHVLHFGGGPRVEGATCGLVWCVPALVYPRHRHVGDEWAFVLSGHAEETGGAVWSPGDLVYRPPASEHGFRVLGDEPYAAVVVHRGIERARGA